MIIYTTAPVAALTGTAKILGISEGSPDEIWERHGNELGLSREEFDSYLAGAATAYALMLGNPQRLSEPLPLQELRQRASFHPPQSFRYMTRTMIDRLTGIDHPDYALLEDLVPTELQQPLPS
jgi:predicted transcriptional regulator